MGVSHGIGEDFFHMVTIGLVFDSQRRAVFPLKPNEIVIYLRQHHQVAAFVTRQLRSIYIWVGIATMYLADCI
jgi:hypothetical protein